jgi:dihydroorotate dehydrogenase electron transfer subunit
MFSSSFAELTVLDVVPFGRESSSHTFALRLSPPPWKSYAPGQFVMLRPCGWGLELPLARPFSVSRLSENGLVCFFQTAGRGTERLTKLRESDAVHVWGPLGNGFAVMPDTPTLLLAGGVGIAPFIGYAQLHPKPWNLFLLFGHKAPADCYPLDSLNERIDMRVMREKAPGDLKRFIAAVGSCMDEYAGQNGLALACGPLPFLRVVRDFASRRGLRLQLSLEARMACGVGACLGCVVKTTERWPVPEKKGAFVQSCVHGPVFWADHVEAEAEMP